jgi:twinkle protein
MINYSDFGLHVPMGKNSGEFHTTCPQCSHTRKKKTHKCLSINLAKKVWRCSHCEWSGALKTQFSKIEYKKPIFQNKTQLSEKAVTWFSKRGIGQEVLLKMKITEGLEWMPQENKELNTIQFNYFRNGELINIKYRDAKKNFKMFKDGEKILYNLDGIKDKNEIIILEGEIDVLSCIQVGVENAVSVPNGATLGQNKLDYIDTCFDYFKDLKTLVIAVDNDQAGRKLAEDLIARFGIENCKYIDWGDCKDANEYLLKNGFDGLKLALENPKEYPIEGVFTISDYESEILDMYDNGLDKGFETGLKDLDEHIRFVKGYMTCITGIPSHGKSEYLDQIVLALMINSKAKGAFFSPENKPTKLHFSKLARKILCKSWDGQFRMTKGEIQQVIEAIDNRLFFIEPEANYTIDSILSKIKQLKQKNNIDFFVIDAWNKLEHHYTDSETKYIGQTINKLEVFCKTNKIHLFMVVHPRKMGYDHKEAKLFVPSPYDIAGSANWYNMFDNHMTVYRNFKEENVEIHITKVKFSHWGKVGYFTNWYDKPSGRYFDVRGLGKGNWLIEGMEGAVASYQTWQQDKKEGADAMSKAAMSLSNNQEPIIKQEELPLENPFENAEHEEIFTEN